MEEELGEAEDFDPLGTAAVSVVNGLPSPLPSPRKSLFRRPGGVSPKPFAAAPPVRAAETSQRTTDFRNRFFPDVTDNQWNNWHWQFRNRFTSFAGLERILRLTDGECASFAGADRALPLSITPYYASLLDENQAGQALRRTVVPTEAERRFSIREAVDPLGEEHDSPVSGLVHRYPDRVLFLTTDVCSTYCRYCTRSRMVGKDRSHVGLQSRWDAAIAYIAATPTVRDVLLSGGDPLTLSDGKLEYLLSRITRIPHVEMVRIGTKVPMVLPQRITLPLTRMLRRYHPLWISIHATHPDELTPEARSACIRLADAGIPLGSQTVLLSGINDNATTMKELMHGLLQVRVRPYYLYQCDPIAGSAHFRTPVARGLEIIRGLRGHTSGYAVPAYVIDAPGGGGKIPLLPDYVVGKEDGAVVLRNYEDKIYRYPEVEGLEGDSHR